MSVVIMPLGTGASWHCKAGRCPQVPLKTALQVREWTLSTHHSRPFDSVSLTLTHFHVGPFSLKDKGETISIILSCRRQSLLAKGKQASGYFQAGFKMGHTNHPQHAPNLWAHQSSSQCSLFSTSRQLHKQVFALLHDITWRNFWFFYTLHMQLAVRRKNSLSVCTFARITVISWLVMHARERTGCSGTQFCPSIHPTLCWSPNTPKGGEVQLQVWD